MYVESQTKKGEHSQDFELNLASIIDCFTVLITYLLVSASFISIGVFDVSAALNGDAADSNTKSPPITLTVQMNHGHDITVNVSGAGVNRAIEVKSREGEYDFATLTAQMLQIKEKYPEVETAVVTAETSVAYKDVVRSIESVKQGVPSVYLGDQEASN